MKFPRNTRIFRSQLDAAPFASVFFLLLIFVLLGSLLYTPGVRVELPHADDLPWAGVEGPTITVAVDAAGRFYFENQRIGKDVLQSRLQAANQKSPEPLTLVVEADKAVAMETTVALGSLARKAGIYHLSFATLPRLFTNSISLYPSGSP